MGWLDLFFPKKCVGCGKMGKYVCEKCEVGMWEEEQICPVCCRASRYGLRHKYCNRAWSIEGLTCFWAYEGLSQKLIKQAKYWFYYDYLGELVRDVSVRVSVRSEFNYFNKFLTTKPTVVPVPLWPKREKERGFNQAEVIGRLVASRWSLEMRSILLRVKDTGRQVGRDRAQRLEAVKEAFKLKTKDQLPKTILLVDDVWTTGATMRECSRVFKQAGAERVWGMVLAR
jgi:competence protein ComFC